MILIFPTMTDLQMALNVKKGLVSILMNESRAGFYFDPDNARLFAKMLYEAAELAEKKEPEEPR